MEEIIKQMDLIKSEIEAHTTQILETTEQSDLQLSEIIDDAIKDDNYSKTIYESKPFEKIVGKIRL